MNKGIFTLGALLTAFGLVTLAASYVSLSYSMPTDFWLYTPYLDWGLFFIGLAIMTFGYFKDGK